jgi:hypothetical protein
LLAPLLNNIHKRHARQDDRLGPAIATSLMQTRVRHSKNLTDVGLNSTKREIRRLPPCACQSGTGSIYPFGMPTIPILKPITPLLLGVCELGLQAAASI